MADAERKIQQLYNDVNAIYGMLDDIGKTQAEHGKQLTDLSQSLTTVRATQLRHGNRLDELDAGIAGLGDQIKEMRVTQMRHETRFTEIDQRFDTQDEQLASQDRKLDLIMKALDISAN
jgi:chromosome segregation ATPase